ncbi:hypothetical protein PR202_ga27199 [Eleusine coracana subsp. coracana]|uniref:Glycosyltransferase n=1 Tax=Eleusine coracana subsp. coracana TaxID=191504 RepID=A0AAV5DFH5_ELECO|nr:hypothetical protein QOZ80_3AG0232290 [Eleusine coracana subsp. coracana]GJN09215.1 hypothetical protein PR202_ga27199 [Eleusine coracana subsp. coracana]
MAAPAAQAPKRAASEGAAAPDQHGAGTEVRRAVKALLFMAAVALPCLVLHRAVAPGAILVRAGGAISPWRLTGNDVDLDSEDARLERVLSAAAMANNTVILTTLNKAWSEPGSVVDVFLESFRIGESTRELLDHLVIVSLDMAAHARCKLIHRHCFALVTDGVDFSGQKNFMTDGYLKMMWRRIDFLRQVLEKGYSFIFTDTDIVWFRNPVPHFYPDGDFQIACDRFNGNPDDLDNNPNGGFTYVRSSMETIEFYKFWYAARENHPGLHDQDVLNFIKRDPFVTELGVRIKFLSTELFGGLCEPSRNMSRVCTMHANCCVGLSRKVSDLNAMLQDWRFFMSLPLKDKQTVSWSVPHNCSLQKLER